MQSHTPGTRFMKSVLLASLAALIVLPAHAQSSTSSNSYQIGSSLEATADPTVPRPHTKPCVVTLLSDEAFGDYSNKPFTYTPPSKCPGPWAKVVFTGDLSIDAGVQYDRTGNIFLGNVDIYFGTTAEPLQNQTNTWHVERDLTDYSALFKSSQSGFAAIYNIVEPGLNSFIHGTFNLEFYPADFANPAPRTFDAVLPIPNNSNGTFAIDTANPVLSQSFTLPTNIESAYLDVFAQSQNSSGEEQWFFCVPTSLAPTLGDCQDTSFREVEVAIDGTPAGVAPVFPWIYTGGLDPYLWTPIPGVQTLNFKPYRIDLTPFAGQLSDGQQHTIGISVYNAYSWFSTDAVLLLNEDHGSKKITGEVTKNTLTAPNPTVDNTVSINSSGIGGGTITTTNSHNFTISGYINTSHGRVVSTVDEVVNFKNVTNISLTTTPAEIQDEVQTSTVDAKTTTQEGPFFTTEETHVSYPFTINLSDTFLSSGDVPQVTSIDQKYAVDHKRTFEGFPIFESHVSNEVTTQDSTEYVLSNGGYYLGPSTGQSSKQTYIYHDSNGGCYNRTITAANLELTNVKDQKDCHDYRVR
ncbi:peptide-N4-asparagine amidase [Acidicapsa dinghuensis]|uniref:Peptide-N4-asparagine amidase n=1 Tax=Acidicapsa dinghuensis TaxID=2218256 RepID=A0ABW1EJG5_9BACT|nr:peptide-N4-asparagine amidase [Acidicapsa dinghuensis]